MRGAVGDLGNGTNLDGGVFQAQSGTATRPPRIVSGVSYPRGPGNAARLSRRISLLSMVLPGVRRAPSVRGEAHAGRHLAGFDVAPQRHQQFPRERYHGDLAHPAFDGADPLDEPEAQRAVRLMAQPSPRELDQQAADPRIAALADPLLAFPPTAVERCPGQTGEPA